MGRPLFLEGEAGVGKTEIAKVLSAALGRKLIRLQCYEGLDVASAVYEWNYAAQMIAIRLAEADGDTDRERLEHDIFAERFLIKRPLLQALEPDVGGRAGAPDRRTRPRRRGVRGLSSGNARGLPGHDSRARHRQGAAAADRHHHLEPHPRNPRRAEAPLPLSLGRLSRRRARTGDRAARRCRVSAKLCRSRSCASCRRCASRICSSRRVSPRRSTGPSALAELDAVALDPATVSDTLGVLLKYQDDIARLEGTKAKELIDEVRAELRAAE